MRKMRRRSTRKMRKTMMEKVCKTVCVGGGGGVRVTRPVDVSVKHVVVQVMKRMKKRTKTRRRAA